MTIYTTRLRQLHRTLAPIMVLPLLLTSISGSLYQLADLGGKGAEFDWLLHLHKGEFGSLHLEAIYPFLNALGLLTLALTGIILWFRTRRTSRKSSE
jgi:uncharacterized iron-regulated membrane protein